jgi:hypothetical protein
MADRYRNDDWRHDPWWRHDQNPGQGFSAWRGDASDPEWHERQYGAGPTGGWGRGDATEGRPRGRGYSRDDYDRDYGQDFGGGRAYGYDRYGRDFVRGRADFLRYDAFPRDWDYAGYGAGRIHAESYRRANYAGRGPKGYRRSDERIREDINDRLTADPHLDASDIDVRVANGIVTLTGNVEHRPAKRYAEDLVEGVIGVDDVNNNLKVRHGFLSGVAGEQQESERELSRSPSRETANPARKSRV